MESFFEAELLLGCFSISMAGLSLALQTMKWNYSLPTNPNWWAVMLRTHGARWLGRFLVATAAAESGVIQRVAQWLFGS
jgi:hypothetical protein